MPTAAMMDMAAALKLREGPSPGPLRKIIAGHKPSGGLPDLHKWDPGAYMQ